MHASMNFSDRALLVFFMLASSLIGLRTFRVPEWGALLAVNGVCLVLIMALVAVRERSPLWMFLHDWYPMGMFIVCFEEVSRLSFVIRDEWQDKLLLAFEGRMFDVPPTVWLGHHGSPLVTEILEVGYFSYFVLLIIVAGMFYPWHDRRPFRSVMDATVLAYLSCYAVFVLLPTEGPAHTLATLHDFPIPGGGPFHWMVGLIQKNAGVHGNAFPSAHVAGGAVALYFAWRYMPKLGLVLTPFVLLLCVGAVYDRYHYVSDVVAGAALGIAAVIVIDRCDCFSREARQSIGL